MPQANDSDIQHTQSAIEYGHKLQQVHDILGEFDLSDEREGEYKAFLL